MNLWCGVLIDFDPQQGVKVMAHSNHPLDNLVNSEKQLQWIK